MDITRRKMITGAVTKMVFHSEAHGLEMDVHYHEQEITPGDFKDPFAEV